jgi:hypothetical protein
VHLAEEQADEGRLAWRSIAPERCTVRPKGEMPIPRILAMRITAIPTSPYGGSPGSLPGMRYSCRTLMTSVCSRRA